MAYTHNVNVKKYLRFYTYQHFILIFMRFDEWQKTYFAQNISIYKFNKMTTQLNGIYIWLDSLDTPLQQSCKLQ